MKTQRLNYVSNKICAICLVGKATFLSEYYDGSIIRMYHCNNCSPVMPNLKNTERQQRPCLNCDGLFVSLHRFNKICDPCKASENFVNDYMDFVLAI